MLSQNHQLIISSKNIHAVRKQLKNDQFHQIFVRSHVPTTEKIFKKINKVKFFDPLA